MPQGFVDEWKFLSNFYPAEVEFGYMTFPTVEHAFQAAKTLDTRKRYAIQSCATPGQAKRMGQTVTLRPNWEDIKVAIMWELLLQKFKGTSSGTSHRAEMLADTADQELVEWNTWHDTTWGRCYCPSPLCSGQGKNLLGKLLMALREEL